MKVRIMRCCYQTNNSDAQKSSKDDECLRPSRPREKQFDFSPRATKGQLISEKDSGVFKSPKKPTNSSTDFCPMKLGRKYVKNLIGFLGDLKTPNIHSEIN